MALLRPFALLVLAGAALYAPAAARAQSLEYEVKAAFLYNFAKFVEWPADAFPEPGAPLTFCVAGEDPFGGRLAALLEGEKVAGRRLALRHPGEGNDLAGCHILFVGRSERERYARILGGLGGASVLTVGDGARFLEQGGVVELKLEADRVRFDVDLGAAARARLKISSKLLRVASRVRGG